jgi:FtsP/CotA-like multicopper oxidase with cupredoxin domain
LFILAMIIGGTAYGIYVSEQSASGMSTADMQGMNHTDTEPSPSPEAAPVTAQQQEPAPTNTEAQAVQAEPKPGQPVKGFTLTAMKTESEIAPGITQPVWTYNGTVPGQEIRVTQGDFLRITLKNELDVPATIHWHGYPVPAEADGVPGLTQDAVMPGETYTYGFSADTAGTYWYHSHQESSEQVDKGLYGALIVEDKVTAPPDKDYTLMLDEWMGEEGGNAHSAHGASSMSEEEMMSAMYNILTVNGKSGSLIPPLETKLGDTVRLRFINAGYQSHGFHIPGEFKVVSTDGQNISEPAVLRDQIVNIAPGERYDIEFTVTAQEDYTINAQDDNQYNDQLVIPVKVAGSNGKVKAVQHDKLTVFDLFSYGEPARSDLSKAEQFTLDYTAVLNSASSDGQQVYTINDKVLSELPALKVKTGDTVRLTFVNEGKVDHPMHVHGHFFQVLEKNGVQVSSTILKDTVLVKPGEKIVVAFKADNPGKWMIHCHELHHAAAGMAQQLEYTDFVTRYTPSSGTDNKPE